MIVIKKLETIEISGSTEYEVVELVSNYTFNGYTLDGEISFSDDKDDEHPYFAYMTKDEFNL